MRASILSLMGLALLAATGCQASGADQLIPAQTDRYPYAEGRMLVNGGSIWYRTVGSDRSRPPLLVLHGGPGAGSRTLESLSALSTERMVVFYDQLGAGRSDHPTDPSLWTIERHIQELNSVRAALGLNRVHILGHSWGAMLLTEYLLTDPAGVVSATFASPLFSTERWIADARMRVRELPADVQNVIETHEQAGTTDSAEYQAAVLAFYRRYLVRTDPWPESMALTLQEFGNDVYAHMWGPSEFTATGTLKDWNRMDALATFKLPTLFTVGEFDETLPATVEDYAHQVAGSRFELIPDAGHLTSVDAPEQNAEIVRSFLLEADATIR